MTVTYDATDLSTDLSKVRLLVRDTDTTEAFFTDEEIEALLVLNSSNIRRAAAMGLERMAVNEAWVLKVMTRGDLQTDGAKGADALRALAKRLNDDADKVETAEEGGSFDIAEMVFDDFSARERLNNQALRGAL